MSDLINHLVEKLEAIAEMPRLRDEELPLTSSTNISDAALQRSYKIIGSIRNDSIQIYTKLDSSGFIAGAPRHDGLQIFLDIKTRSAPYPVVPTQLSNFQQISMVIVAADFSERGYTREVYEYLATLYTLVSDSEQYLGAERLWRSLARSTKIGVYVFDGSRGDYVRQSGKPVQYNGSNIDHKLIWGDTIDHNTRLLVATNRAVK